MLDRRMPLGRESSPQPGDAPRPGHARPAPPTRFDLDNVEDVAILDDVRLAFSEAMQDTAGPYGGCIWKPSSVLPYPKPVIRAALTALLDFAEGRRSSRHLDGSLRTEEKIDAIRNALNFLATYLDIPAADLPTSPSDNLIAAEKYLEREAKVHSADDSNAAPAQGELLATSLARTVARLAFPLDVSHASREELAAFLLTSLGGALPHGVELALGQRTLRQAVWPITFLCLGALALNTALNSEGTPIDMATVMEQMVMGVLPSFSRSKQARVYAAANATFWRILDNYTEEEGAWVEVIANGVVRYALEGSREGEEALGGLCEFLEPKFRIEDP